MRTFKLAAGFAVGYVLGSRAGRQTYEQIAATARTARDHPAVTQAQQKAKALLSTRAKSSGTSAVQPLTGTDSVLPEPFEPVPASSPVRPPRRQ